MLVLIGTGEPADAHGQTFASKSRQLTASGPASNLARNGTVDGFSLLDNEDLHNGTHGSIFWPANDLFLGDENQTRETPEASCTHREFMALTLQIS